MAKYMAELGLLPVARSRVSAIPKRLQKPLALGQGPRKFDGLLGGQPTAEDYLSGRA